MARVDNLENFLTDVAGAIKTKKGTTDKIPAANFDTEIAGITSGLDTSDATATADDIINPKTAYVNGKKITGTIKATYEEDMMILDKSFSNLSKSISYNIGISEDGKYLLDCRAVNNKNMIQIYDCSEDASVLKASIELNVATIINVDLKFSPIIENGIYRFAVSSKNQINVYDFDSNANIITFLQTVTLPSNYSEDSVYQICYTNTNKNVFTVVHTNLDQWGDGPAATTIKLLADNTFTILWSRDIIRWQAGHFCCWNYDDTAFCYNSTHDDNRWNRAAGYILVNTDYSIISKNDIATQCCYIDVTNNHRINDSSLQVLSNGAWSTVITLPSTPNDPDFALFNKDDTLVYIGSSTTNLNNVYVYAIDWTAKTATLTATIAIPTDHMFFGSNTGNQVIGLIGFNKERTIIYNRKTIPVIVINQKKNMIATIQSMQQSGGRALYKTSDATGISSDLLENKIMFNGEGKIKGTMPNNGELNYTPTEKSQIIPAGYTSGGTIASMDITTSEEYNNCVNATNIILGNRPEYIQLTYIQANGTQWLDTGYTPNDNTKITIELSDIVKPNETAIFGANTTWKEYSYLLYCLNSEKMNWTYNGPITVTSDLTSKHTITMYRSTVTLDGSTVSTDTQINSSAVNSTLTLFSIPGGQYRGSYKLYSFKIYENGALIKNYIPVKDALNAVCLYDTINKQYIYNQGLNKFISGEEVK